MQITIASTTLEPAHAMTATIRSGHDEHTAVDALEMFRGALIAYGFQPCSVDDAILDAALGITNAETAKELEGQ